LRRPLMEELANEAGMLNQTKTCQDQITEFLYLHTSLERKLQLTALDDNIWKIEQMDLKGVLD
jgi:hypothetical protein